MVLDTPAASFYLLIFELFLMPTTALETPRDEATGAPLLTHSAAPSSTLIILSFSAIYLIWGSTYLGIRIGIESFPPLLLAGTRHFLTGLILYPILRWKTRVRPTLAHWRTAVVTGVLLLFIGNVGVCVAEGTGPSCSTSLLVATVSLWIVLIDWLRPGGARPIPRVVAGILMVLAALVLLGGPPTLPRSRRIHPPRSDLLPLPSPPSA